MSGPAIQMLRQSRLRPESDRRYRPAKGSCRIALQRVVSIHPAKAHQHRPAKGSPVSCYKIGPWDEVDFLASLGLKGHSGRMRGSGNGFLANYGAMFVVELVGCGFGLSLA